MGAKENAALEGGRGGLSEKREEVNGAIWRKKI